MSAVTLRQARAVTFAVVGVAAIGIASFLVTRAVAAPDTADPWLVPMAQPSLTTELDPDLPIGEALLDRLAELESVAGDPDQLLLDPALLDDEGSDQLSADDEPRFEPPAAGPLPPGISSPHRPVDLSGAGLAPPSAEELEDLRTRPDGAIELERLDGAVSTPLPDSTGPALDVVLSGPARTIDVGARSDTEDEPDDSTEPLPAPTAEEERDEEAELFFPLLWDRGTLPSALGRFLIPSEPDFLDACAGTVDGETLDCGEGVGATVLELREPFQLLSLANDPGPRCADQPDALGRPSHFPLRVSFNREPAALRIAHWARDADGAWQHRRALSVDLSEHRQPASTRHGFVYDRCVAMLYPSRTPELRIQVTAVDRFGQPVRFRTVMDAPTGVDGQRPHVRLQTLGDDTVRAFVPNREGLAVVATLVSNLPDRPTEELRCPAGTEDSEVLDVVTLRSAGSVAATVDRPQFYDPRYDRLERFRFQLEGEPTTRYLCLRWEETIGTDTRRVVERTAYQIRPPRQMRLEAIVTAATFFDESQLGWFPPDGFHLRLQLDDGTACTLSRSPDMVARDLPYRLCAMDVSSSIRGGVLQLITTSRRDDREPIVRSFRVRLASDPEHPRFNECGTCTDVYDFTLTDVSDPPRTLGQLQVALVSRPPLDAGSWVIRQRADRQRDADPPLLDVDRTQVITGRDGDPDALNRIEVAVFADRPVRAQLVARPQRSLLADQAIPPGCPATSLPHVVTSGARFADRHTLEITDACAATRYRLALELVDEDGNRAVYGDLWTWLLADQPDLGLGGREETFIPGRWDPVITTAGRDWLVTYELRVNQIHPDGALPVGVHVGRVPVTSGVVPSPGFDVEADRSRLILAETRLGPIQVSRGRHTGDTPCIDRGRRYTEPWPQRVTVGDALRVQGQTQMESLIAGTLTPLDGMTRCRGRINFVRHYELPPGPDGSAPIVPTSELEEAGEVTVVMVSRGKEFADTFGYRFQTIVTIRVEPTPPGTPRTLRGSM